MTVERDIIITQRLLKTETKEMALLAGRQVLTTKKVPTMLTKKDSLRKLQRFIFSRKTIRISGA